ncbi:MAG TPA: TA system VapC family ribonuclease toxin [Dyella sp.]|uniref:type II toxin-antitoxin system VapC family toxin n=1 Tax=Dyella sp. TaxID=1869338 RepID=UPI002D0ADF9C|nr:TA system VapC family ribonuclease toxin [Dyella sp.]HUB88343.1 TA system VapC family ribonuclease toxin [Dyella sp.]
MIAVDTNILAYAHRPDYRDEHSSACDAMTDLMAGTRTWTVPWPCVHEFLALVTNPRAFREPTPINMAFAAVQAWFESPRFVRMGESAAHLQTLERIARHGKVKGGMYHDARIAAICLDNGVTEFWTADRDFSRFPELYIRNPLVA